MSHLSCSWANTQSWGHVSYCHTVASCSTTEQMSCPISWKLLDNYQMWPADSVLVFKREATKAKLTAPVSSRRVDILPLSKLENTHTHTHTHTHTNRQLEKALFRLHLLLVLPIQTNYLHIKKYSYPLILSYRLVLHQHVLQVCVIHDSILTAHTADSWEKRDWQEGRQVHWQIHCQAFSTTCSAVVKLRS